jgi:Protein of unknown function (DUF1501)
MATVRSMTPRRSRGGLQLDRRQLLWSSAAALLGGPRLSLAQGTSTPAKHLIVVFAEGGWDVTYCFDPKLDCSGVGGAACSIQGPELDEDAANPDDRESVKTFGNIPIIVNDVKRPAVSAFFDQWHPRAHVINGIFTGSIAHEPCRIRLLTGTADGTKPDLASISGFTHGEALPLGTVDLSGWSISGPLASSSGRLGYQSQITALLDDESQFNAPAALGADYPLFTMDAADEASVEAFVRSRADALLTRFGDGEKGQNRAAINDLLISLDRGTRFRSQAADILKSLQIGQESSFGDQLVIGVDLIEAGMCHSVVIDTRQEFDTHSFNFAQHGALDQTFSGLSTLMGTLEAKGMLDDVVVAVISEMTRTPLRNAAAGKDHWGHTSAMLLGGISGNRVSGHTSNLLESMPMDLQTGEALEVGDLCKYDNFCAGVLELLDVDPEAWLPGVVPFRGAHPA